MEVSTHMPLQTADIDAPLPKWAITSRKFRLPTISAARPAQYEWLSPWKP
jgi:hypothetical protein